MKFISWNVNGIRACMGKGFLDFLRKRTQIFSAYRRPNCRRDRLIWSCQAIINTGIMRKRKVIPALPFCKEEALKVTYGIGVEEHDHEGRVITLEYPDFYFVTVYTPNSQNELARLDYRMKWEDDFLAYLKKLEVSKPVIFCGDLNVAHKEIDLKNPKTNRKNAGFTDEERGKFTALVDAGIY